MITYLKWAGIVFCITQSAMFSGLNLAFFSISKLRLEIDARHGSKAAAKVLKMRADSNFLLATILWGNVGINVLLTLFSNSLMSGLIAFLFSTIVITFLGEIIPQAYFSRNALKMASILSPVLRIYQFLLFPITKSTSLVLDAWLGKESVHYLKEKNLKQLILKHVYDSPEIDHVEGLGAINFLSLDDLPVSQEGELIDPDSIVKMKFEGPLIKVPKYKENKNDPFLRKLNRSGKKWVILIDQHREPRAVLDADGFLRSALFDYERSQLLDFIHYPIIVKHPSVPLGDIIERFDVTPESRDDDVIDRDVVIYWGHEKKVITGADILGRLLRGIAKHKKR
jgi:metal transporter CNNM